MDRDAPQESEFKDRLVYLNRTAKVVKGGRRFSFSATVVVGDGNGRVGIGMGKAREVPDAIRKGVERAKKSMVSVKLSGTTIPHFTVGKYGAARVVLRPAAKGTGVIAGGPVRALMEVVGIQDILTKSLGTSNQSAVVKAALEGLLQLRNLDIVAKLRGKSTDELAP